MKCFQWRLMLLHVIVLGLFTGVLMGQSVGPAVDDNNVLDVLDVTIDGPKARLVHEGGQDFVGFWDELDTSIYWKVRVVKGGVAKVFVSQAVPREYAGSEYAFVVGDQELRSKTVGTDEWASFEEKEIGEVRLEEGVIEVRMKPMRHVEPNLFMCLKAVRFEGDVVVEAVGEDDNFEPIKTGDSGYVRDGVRAYYPADVVDVAGYESLMMVEKLPIIQRFSEEEKTGEGDVRFEKNEGRYRATIDVPMGGNVYGGGEVTGPLERSGIKTKFWNSDNFAYVRDRGSRLYQTHPWMMVVREDGSAFGVIADSTWRGQVEVSEGMIVFTFDGEPFRVLVLEGDGPEDVLMKLGELTGKMKLPPKWALGYQQCRWSYEPDTKVMAIADEFRKRRLPCDVIWMDIDYMDEFRVFTFDKQKFGDPKGLNNYLNERGFKGVWMIDPGVKKDDESGYGVYESGTAKDVWVRDAKGEVYEGDVWPGACVFPDFTRADVREWWAGLYKDYMAQGVSGVWNDMNEPAVFSGPDYTMPMTNLHEGDDEISAGTHREYHNVYGFLMVRASREGMMRANPEKRPFVLTRSNYLGGQRYAATWTGDNKSTVEHMELSVPMTLTLGLSGQPFNGPDLGGFSEQLDGELWAKWIGFGTMFPFVRGHAMKGMNDKEPWAFGEVVEDVSRVALERRYRLMPYFYTVFEAASRTGLPIMRPMFMADAKDQSLRYEDRAFLVGQDLMVVPRWAEDVALPSGVWESVSLVGEMIDDEKYQADLKVRGGAIVPMGPVMQYTDERSLDELTLVVVLDERGEALGELYEDAGDGYGYQKGEYLRTTYRVVMNGRKDIRVWIEGREGRWKPIERKVVVEVWSDGEKRMGVIEREADLEGNGVFVELSGMKALAQ
ncbi:TIM-barrel domain-containing protein [Poriferisphaera corsica]|uniref:TIM-barrel domain-containing protein n=1 Tax=Poriferisphaera corsica TaxID=2528020 RepID=UPI00119E91CF|nr:TIM-barrel domain-containing protein [Poriferisphaera corsica]